MNVYGYLAPNSVYPYNQSSELSKQMNAQQVLAGGSDYRDIRQPHFMPVPSGAPWTVQGVSWGMTSPPQLVQFTAQHTVAEPNFMPALHCKTKIVDVEPVIPAKQRITEEKMAAHLNSLHISEHNTYCHPSQTQDVMDVGMDVPSTSVAEKLKGHRIVLSEEIKKLKDEPLLPPALIERLEKPCMSLVVWHPKKNVIEKTIEEEKNSEDDIDEIDIAPVKRTGVLVTELNTNNEMDVEM